MRLKDKVAVVTGAASGIGKEIALVFAREGAKIAIADLDQKAAEATAREIDASGKRAVGVAMDVANEDQVEAGMARVIKTFDAIDVLISNAGLGHRQKFEDVTSADFDEMVAVNLRAPFLLAQATVPGMAERGWGRVLFVSSAAAFTGGIVGPHYAASKAGLHGLAHYLAARFARAGVTVNVVAPALIADTGLLPGEPEMLRHQVPVGRLGRPVEVADLSMAILRNPYLTSQVVSLDGGMYPR